MLNARPPSKTERICHGLSVAFLFLMLGLLAWFAPGMALFALEGTGILFVFICVLEGLLSLLIKLCLSSFCRNRLDVGSPGDRSTTFSVSKQLSERIFPETSPNSPPPDSPPPGLSGLPAAFWSRLDSPGQKDFQCSGSLLDLSNSEVDVTL